VWRLTEEWFSQRETIHETRSSARQAKLAHAQCEQRCAAMGLQLGDSAFAIDWRVTDESQLPPETDGVDIGDEEAKQADTSHEDLRTGVGDRDDTDETHAGMKSVLASLSSSVAALGSVWDAGSSSATGNTVNALAAMDRYGTTRFMDK
jgi:hypothetical protein